LGPLQKNIETLETPQVKELFLKIEILNVFSWPTYIGEKRTTLGKSYAMKVWCYRENLGEHIKNFGTPLGT
jgi:hypothetical protein